MNKTDIKLIIQNRLHNAISLGVIDSEDIKNVCNDIMNIEAQVVEIHITEDEPKAVELPHGMTVVIKDYVNPQSEAVIGEIDEDDYDKDENGVLYTEHVINKKEGA